MAVIGKIRNKMGILLVVFVGVALLAFVLGDLLSSAGYLFSGDQTTVGKMNGKSIKIDEFDLRVKQKEALFAQMNGGATVDEDTRQGILDETWQEFVEKYVWNQQFEAVGLRVSQEELKDMLGGKFVHPYIQQQFTNPETGIFDATQLQSFLAYISDESSVQDDAQLADWKMRRAQWTNIESFVERNRLQTKYQTLVEKGLYVTEKEIARQYAESGDRFNIRFVGKQYAEVADSTIEVSDADLKKAYEENKIRFKSDFAVRGLRFASFDVIPTKGDSAALFSQIAALKADFEKSTDDTAFVFQNSDLQNEPRFLRKELLPKKADSALYNAPNGLVYGPYVDGGAYFLAKKSGEIVSADSVKVTAILLARNSQQGPIANATQRADSIFAAIKAGADIKALAFSLSQDPTTAKDSGNIGWVPYEVAGVNPIIDSAYNAPVGGIRLVETADAYAIVRNEAKTAPVRKVLIAFVSLDIKASEETGNAAYTAASDFALANKTPEDFEKAMKSGKYIIRDDNFLRENAKTVLGIDDSRALVKWAFEKEVGAVSAIEQYGNRYIVAIVTKARKAGIPDFEEVKDDLIPVAKRDKKAAMFMEEMKAAAASGNIDQVAAAIKKPVTPATDITFSAFSVPGAGYEPAITGAASGAPQGKMVGPFKGMGGVYVVIVDNISKGAVPPAGQQQKADMSRMLGQRAFSEAFEAINSAAEVRDMRYRFY